MGSPFCVRLVCTFKNEQYVYFLMEAALGGELLKVYVKCELWRKEDHARFYGACVVLALDHLHARSIIYRDLKPANVLLDESGYAKVTDFGLAKVVCGRTYTQCGTPDYWAPEVVTGDGHGKTIQPYNRAVDWWALGIFIYELMMEDTPFYNEEIEMVIKKIKLGIKIAKFDEKDRNAAWTELVKSLCKDDPSARIAVRPRGVYNVKNHRWFTEGNFDWAGLDQRRMQPPFKPNSNSKDTGRREQRVPSCFKPLEGTEEDLPEFVKCRKTTGWDKGFEDCWGPAELS